MFSSPDSEQLDPALLAFVKCHVTSPIKWEILRVLASQDGAWIDTAQLGRVTHRQSHELEATLAELTSDALVEQQSAGASNDVSAYRLAADEPTSVVLHRLIEAATHSFELRAIIAAQLQHVRQQTRLLRTIAAA